MKLSIGSRLLLATALVVISAFALFTFYFYSNESHNIKANLVTNVRETAKLANSSITNWLNGRQKMIENLAQNIEALPDTHDLQAARKLVEKKALSESFFATFYGMENGQMIIHPPGLPKDYDPRARPWYQASKAARSSLLTEPYPDALTRELVLSLTAPVYHGDEYMGAAGGDLELPTLISLINSIDFGGMGYAFLVNNKGTVLIHPNPELALKSFKEAFPTNTPNLSLTIDSLANQNTDTLYAFVPIKDLVIANWSLGIAIDRDKAFARLPEFRNTAALSTLLVISAVILLVGFIVRNRISIPITRMTNAMTQLANGNHNVEIPEAQSDDEIGAMRAAVQVFKTNACEIMQLQDERLEYEAKGEKEKQQALEQAANEFEQSVIGVVESLSVASSSLNSFVFEMSNHMEETARLTSESAAASEEVSQYAESIASATEELTASITEISRQCENTINISTETEAIQEAIEDTLKAAMHDMKHSTSMLETFIGSTSEAQIPPDVFWQKIKQITSATEQHILKVTSQCNELFQHLERLDHVHQAFAQAANEQVVAAADISRNTTEAAGKAACVSQNMAGVEAVAKNANTESINVSNASGDLAIQADILRLETSEFLKRIRDNNTF